MSVVRTIATLILVTGVLGTGLGACGGGGGGGSTTVAVGPFLAVPEVEPNATSATATPLSASGAGQGTLLLPGDVDWWSLAASAGAIRVELKAVRLDQPAWDGNSNRPRIALIAPNGITVLVEHAPTAAAWPHGASDLDFQVFIVPTAGTYFLRVAQDAAALPGGKYAIVVKTISPLSVYTELEPVAVAGPNDVPASAEPIGIPNHVHGFHVNTESDWYSFTISTPSILRADVVAYQNGLSLGSATLFDPRIRLWNALLTLLQTSDNARLLDPALAFQILSPGTYFLQVDNSGGTGTGEYLLSVTQAGAPSIPTEVEPNGTPVTSNSTNYSATVRGSASIADDDYHKFFGEAGDVVVAQFFDLTNSHLSVDHVGITIVEPDGVTVRPGSVNGPLQTYRTILRTSGDHFLRVFGFGGPTDYSVRLDRVSGSSLESEPNNTQATPDALPSAGRIMGTIGAPGDADFYSFGAVAGEVVTLNLYGGQPFRTPWVDDAFDTFGSLLAPTLVVQDPAAVVVTTSVHTPPGPIQSSAQGITDGVATVQVSFVAATAGTYTVGVGDQFATGGVTHFYQLERR